MADKFFFKKNVIVSHAPHRISSEPRLKMEFRRKVVNKSAGFNWLINPWLRS